MYENRLNNAPFLAPDGGDTGATGNVLAANGITADKIADDKPQSFDDVLKEKAHQAEFDRRVAKARYCPAEMGAGDSGQGCLMGTHMMLCEERTKFITVSPEMSKAIIHCEKAEAKV